MATPMSKPREKIFGGFMLKKNIASKTRMTVREVLMERLTVWLTLAPTTASKLFLFTLFLKFSRILSKTTMVSWTEKPRTVRSAV